MGGKFNRRGLIALLLGIVMLIGLCGCGKNADSLDRVLQNKRLVFGVTADSCPVAFSECSEDGTVTPYGLAVDIANELAARLNVEAEFVFLSPDKAVDALNNGDIDCYACLTGLGIKETAQLATIDSGMDCRQVFAVASDSSITRLVDMTGRKVYAVSGSDAAAKLSEASVLKSELGAYFQFDSLDELIEALDEHSCDAIAVDELELLYATRLKHECVVLNEHISSSDYVLAFRLRDTSLSERISLLYADMCADGSLDSIKNKWLG